MTQYKIQVGSWTKLPNGKVQEDTRDIQEMMAKATGTHIERFRVALSQVWRYVGFTSDQTPLVHVYDNEKYNEPSLFIPYEELQKMLNAPQVHAVPSLLNTKLDCRKADGSVDEELSRAFQEAVTKGMHNKYGGWSINSYKESVERFTSVPFLFVSESGMLSLGDFDEEGHFNSNSKTQINFTYSRTLTWEATEIEPVTPEPADEMVDICGVEYSAKELSEALALIKAARKG